VRERERERERERTDLNPFVRWDQNRLHWTTNFNFFSAHDLQ